MAAAAAAKDPAAAFAPEQAAIDRESAAIGAQSSELERQAASLKPPQAPAEPKLEATPAAPTRALPAEVQHQIGQFGMQSLIMAALSGRNAGEALAGATNYLAGAVAGINAGDEARYRDDLSKWRTGVEAAVASNRDALGQYAAILKSRQLPYEEKLKQLQVLALSLKDRATANAAAQGRLDHLVAHLDSVQQANERLAQEQASLEERVRHDRSMEALRGATSGAPAATPANVKGPRGDAYLKTLPTQQASLIKAVDEGRVKISSFAWLRPEGKQLFAQVAQYDPDFDMTTYEKRVRTQTDFASGRAAQTVTALNMVMGHLAELKRAGEAMNNMDFPAANAAVNYLRQITGDPRVVDFNTARQAVQDELERVFRGSAGSERDIEEWAKNISPNASPAQMDGAWRIMIGLLDSRINSIGEQYSRGMGVNRSGLSLLGPHAQSAYEFISGRKAPPATYEQMGGAAPTGAASVPSFATEAQAAQAAASGQIRSGERIRVGGVEGRWQAQ